MSQTSATLTRPTRTMFIGDQYTARIVLNGRQVTVCRRPDGWLVTAHTATGDLIVSETAGDVADARSLFDNLVEQYRQITSRVAPVSPVDFFINSMRVTA